MKRTLSAVALFASFIATAQTPAPSWQHPPKLIVGIVVDQMRTDYIYRYWNDFGDSGFKRLLREGNFQRDVRYDYVPTVTGPGHASIFTGTTPARHGITQNNIYDRDSSRTFYCVADSKTHPIGNDGVVANKPGASPRMLLASTLADELELRTNGKSHTIGIALKDRSAILPIGRSGDGAFWMDRSTGKFISSTWYGATALPAWMSAFNTSGYVDHFLDSTWTPDAKAKTNAWLPDQNDFEDTIPGKPTSTFPYVMRDMVMRAKTMDVLSYTPYGNMITTQAAIAAIAGDSLGMDAITDILTISYSSPDILGHKVGPRTIEEEDMYIKLDRELARLLNHLDQHVGKQQYTLFLTADHGVVDVPAFLASKRASAGYTDEKALKHKLEQAIHDNSRLSALPIAAINEGQIWFAGPVQSHDEAHVQEVLRLLRADTSITCALSATELSTNEYTDGIRAALQKGFMPQRCGDILFALRPDYFEGDPKNEGRGTTHGAGWNYDTSVPVIFFGAGVQPGEVLRTTRITDIAPTVCAIVGMALPNAASGQAVPEVVKVR